MDLRRLEDLLLTDNVLTMQDYLDWEEVRARRRAEQDQESHDEMVEVDHRVDINLRVAKRKAEREISNLQNEIKEIMKILQRMRDVEESLRRLCEKRLAELQSNLQQVLVKEE